MPKIIIVHYVRVNDYNGDVVYENGKPKIAETLVDLPIKFSYDSYNEPKRVSNTDINAEHVIELKSPLSNNPIHEMFDEMIDVHYNGI